MNKSLFVVVVMLLVFGGGYYLWNNNQASAPIVEQPITDQPSEQTPNHPLITVTAPTQNQKISSPLTISGQARGQWYFEATFPFELQDGNEVKLAEGFATAQGDWMTTEYVPFTAQLSFPTPSTPTGKLIIRKSNASGLPENDDSIEVPVQF